LYAYFKHNAHLFAMPRVKEVMEFSKEQPLADAEKKLVSYFEPEVLKGQEATPKIGLADVKLLYFHEAAAQKLKAYNPQAKIIIMLRQPVNRAFSAYHYARLNELESIETFEEAVKAEDERLKHYTAEQRFYNTYLNLGLYHEQVATYLNAFGPEQVKVLIFEELIKNPEAVVADTLDFLQVDKASFDFDIVKERFNEGGSSKFPLLTRLFRRKNLVRSLYGKALPLSVRMKLQEKLIEPIKNANKKAATKKEKDPQLMKSLQDYFRADVQQLEKLIGRSLKEWWF